MSELQTRGDPHPADVHVGNRIRLRRLMLNLSQQALGEALGVSFQQVQKYEWGYNRISASRLWMLCSALDIPVSYFFEGLEGGIQHEGAADADDHIGATEELINSSFGVELAKALSGIESTGIRHAFLELARSCAAAENN